MISALVIVGSSSYVLSDYKPSKDYTCVYQSCRRVSNSEYNSGATVFKLDLESAEPDFKGLIEELERFDEVDVVFAAYATCGLSECSSFSEIQSGLMANCNYPVYFFQSLSKGLAGKRIRGVFISSIYAHVAPMPENYAADSKMNPLYYGVAKAGVEQGLRWLTVQEPDHTFNSIILGPMPRDSVRSESPVLINNLVRSMSSGKLVERSELYGLIDYLLSCGISTRGASIRLDGGYLCY